MKSRRYLWFWLAGGLALGVFIAARSTRGQNILLDLRGKRMYLSIQGQDVLKRLEGFRPTVYPDSAGLPTIGYGHKLKPGEAYPDGVDDATATALLSDDIHTAEDVVNAAVSVDLTQEQFDALVIFVDNTASREPEKFTGSTLLRKLNAGDFAGAAAEFPRWDKVHVGGQLVANAGLASRRAAEAALFSEGVYA